jgi:hypothetical protein
MSQLSTKELGEGDWNVNLCIFEAVDTNGDGSSCVVGCKVPSLRLGMLGPKSVQAKRATKGPAAFLII